MISDLYAPTDNAYEFPNFLGVQYEIWRMNLKMSVFYQFDHDEFIWGQLWPIWSNHNEDTCVLRNRTFPKSDTFSGI